MKLTIVKAVAMLFASVSSIAFAAEDVATHINIAKNKVGLPDYAKCEVYHTGEGFDVTCNATFKNVGVKPTCATCTPGWLSFENYIGSLTGPRLEGPGKTRAMIFCDGECVSIPKTSPILP